MTEFLMPSLGADMEDAEVVEWLVKPGDMISHGDIVAVVETQKGAIEIECFQAGVLEEIVAQVGAIVPVGDALAIIKGEAEPPAPLPPERPAAKAGKKVQKRAPEPRTLETAVGERRRVTPAARRLAGKLGVDLEKVEGSGAHGAIQLSDIEEQSKAARARKGGAKAGLDLDEMRKAIGAAMAKSAREIPHYYIAYDVDVTDLISWLSEENESRPISERLLSVVPLMKAMAMALKKTPELNGFYTEGGFQPADDVHIGVGISLRGGGLMAPAIRNVDQRELNDLMAALRDLTGRARSGRLRSSELTDSTVTLSSIGDAKADSILPIIYPPQVAIAGLGMIRERPWVVDNAVVPRSILTLTIGADHRVSDGRRAADFVKHFEQLLREPDTL